MPWWGWVSIGVFLLGAELFGIDAAFYLIFVGFAMILTGRIDVSVGGMEIWVQFMIFGVISIFLLVLFRKRLYKKFRGVATDLNVGPTGEKITLEATLPPGGTGRQRFRGSQWTVVNEGATELQQGTRVQISRVDGLNLIVGE